MWACNTDVVPSDSSYVAVAPLVEREEQWGRNLPLQTTLRMLQECCNIAQLH